MWSFFHGWRRKAGVVTLGLACAVYIAWMRSTVIADVIMKNPDQASSFRMLLSSHSRISYWLWRREGFRNPIYADYWETIPIDSEKPRIDPELRFWKNDAHIQLQLELHIEYWKLVLPLTLLSAYLLLWKPRKRG